MARSSAKPDARSKLPEAALTVIRTKGYSATTVDELCAAAGVTKGAFFHHFKTKDELGVAAADHWSETTGRCLPRHPITSTAIRSTAFWPTSISARRCFRSAGRRASTERAPVRTVNGGRLPSLEVTSISRNALHGYEFAHPNEHLCECEAFAKLIAST